MVQINDEYVAALPSLPLNDCTEIPLEKFTTKDWKRLSGYSGIPVYKIQLLAFVSVKAYSEYDLPSSRAEHVPEGTRPDCIPRALYRPSVDWRQVTYPTQDRVMGNAEIHYQIDQTGTVRSVAVTSSGGSEEIDQKLISTVRTWRYKPAPGCGIRETYVYLNIDPGAMSVRTAK